MLRYLVMMLYNLRLSLRPPLKSVILRLSILSGRRRETPIDTSPVVGVYSIPVETSFLTRTFETLGTFASTSSSLSLEHPLPPVNPRLHK